MKAGKSPLNFRLPCSCISKNLTNHFLLSSYCVICKKTFQDCQFARYPNGVIVHIQCMKDPKVCPLTGQLFTVDSWEAGGQGESPPFSFPIRPCDTPKIRKTICQTDEKNTQHSLLEAKNSWKKSRFCLATLEPPFFGGTTLKREQFICPEPEIAQKRMMAN